MAPDTHSPPLICTQLLGRAQACDWHPAREGSGKEGLRTVGSEVSGLRGQLVAREAREEAGGAALAADALACGKGWQTRVWTWVVGRWPPGAQPGPPLRA